MIRKHNILCMIFCVSLIRFDDCWGEEYKDIYQYQAGYKEGGKSRSPTRFFRTVSTRIHQAISSGKSAKEIKELIDQKKEEIKNEAIKSFPYSWLEKGLLKQKESQEIKKKDDSDFLGFAPTIKLNNSDEGSLEHILKRDINNKNTKINDYIEGYITTYLNRKNNKGLTALTLQASSSKIKDDNQAKAIMELLIKNGAQVYGEPTYTDNDNQFLPIVQAAKSGKLESVRFLFNQMCEDVKKKKLTREKLAEYLRLSINFLQKKSTQTKTIDFSCHLSPQ